MEMRHYILCLDDDDDDACLCTCVRLPLLVVEMLLFCLPFIHSFISSFLSSFHPSFPFLLFRAKTVNRLLLFFIFCRRTRTARPTFHHVIYLAFVESFLGAIVQCTLFARAQLHHPYKVMCSYVRACAAIFVCILLHLDLLFFSFFAFLFAGVQGWREW